MNIVYPEPKDVDMLTTSVPQFPKDHGFPGVNLGTDTVELLDGPGMRKTQEGLLQPTRLGKITQTGKYLQTQICSSFCEPQIGDVLICRVIRILPGRWILEGNSTQEFILKIDSFNLPGLQRTRDQDDEANMRAFLRENDLICVEYRGCSQVHTRNKFFGKLQHGILFQGPVRDITSNEKFLNIQGKVSLIIASNGRVWVSGRRDGAETAILDSAKQVLKQD